MNTKVYTIANQKGGVGKTTTCHVLATAIAEQGKKVLVIDVDPQCNLTATFNIEVSGTIYEVLKGQRTITSIIAPVNENLDLIASSQLLANANLEFRQLGAEYMIKEVIEPIKGDYEYIFIDTPPTIGILNVAALVASQKVIVPLLCDAYSCQGLVQFEDSVRTVKRYYNPDIEIAGLLMTRVQKRTNLAKEVLENVREYATTAGTKMYENTIRSGVAVSEAQYKKQTLTEQKKNSGVKQDYEAFVAEFLEGEK